MKLHPRLRAEGVVLARRGERLRAVAERDARGWVVGYGHRASAREGARVGEDDATALLVYDLSRSAEGLAPLLTHEVSPELFDALNAYALRGGPEALAGSALLARVNAGEAVAPGEVLAARDRLGEPPPSAVLAAAEAVRDRVSQALDVPEPPSRPRWELRVEEAASDPEVADPGAYIPAHPGEGRDPGPPAVQGSASQWRDPASALPELDPDLRRDERGADEFKAAVEPPPFIEPSPQPVSESDTHGDEPMRAEHPTLRTMTSAPPAAPARVVSFERGGRARLWDRVRRDPRVYLAVGACGLVLFLCALAGVLVEHPTPFGLALGFVGLLCLAPAVAFFLQRRGG